MNEPLPPMIEGAAQEGGGTPNGRGDAATSHQNSPASDLAPTSRVTTDKGMTPMLTSITERLGSLVDPEADKPPLRMLWDGAPSQEALRQLRLESYCPSFVVEQAAEVLARLWEGEPLKRICRDGGMPARSVVMWWAQLVPEFGVMLESAQTGLGAVMRDEAMEIVLDAEADPARSRAALAVAAAYDRRISKGDTSDVNVATGITVTVQKFGSDD